MLAPRLELWFGTSEWPLEWLLCPPCPDTVRLVKREVSCPIRQTDWAYQMGLIGPIGLIGLIKNIISRKIMKEYKTRQKFVFLENDVEY